MATTNTSGFGSLVIKKRMEANFENWKECMKHYLIGQDLGSIVFGEEEKPQANDPNYKDWTKKNAMALHAIENSCEEDTISNLMRKYPSEVDSAKFVWEHLAKKPSKVKHYKEEGTCYLNFKKFSILIINKYRYIYICTHTNIYIYKGILLFKYNMHMLL